MKITLAKPFWQALGLGTLAGFRSMSAPALTSHILSHHRSKALEHSPLSFMASPKTALAFKIMAAGEFVGDKMPQAKDRIAFPVITGRVVCGALSGASVYKASGRKAYIGALLGGAAAIASTFGSFYLRKFAVKSSGIMDPIIGGIEDALVVGASAGFAEAA